jgi:hypothetical protein
LDALDATNAQNLKLSTQIKKSLVRKIKITMLKIIGKPLYNLSWGYEYIGPTQYQGIYSRLGY